MCHGHPRRHPCSHTSINWHYCPAAMIDLATGVETPCRHLTYASSQPSASDCPLQNCQYKAMGGSWTCCQCNHGPNETGWCENFVQLLPDDPIGIQQSHLEQCAHGCCERCTRSVHSPVSDMAFAEPRKGTASRKFGYQANLRLPHRRNSGFSILSSFSSTVDEEATQASQIPGSPLPKELNGGPSSSGNKISTSSRYATGLDYANLPGSPMSGFRKHRASSAAGKTHRGKKHKVAAY